MKFTIALIALVGLVEHASAFAGTRPSSLARQPWSSCSQAAPKVSTALLAATPPDAEDAEIVEDVEDANVDVEEVNAVVEEPEFASEEDKMEAVGNLVEDDEWLGLTMELTELIRLSVIEDVKKNAREFLGT